MKDIQITTENIDVLLQRFFDGETDRAEETALEAYFLTAEDIPEQYKPYREMFGWYAAGMPEDQLPPLPTPKSPALWRKLAWGISVAAAVALMIMLPGGHQSRISADISCYEGSFMMRDGEMIPLTPDLKPEIEALLVEASCLEQEIDLRMGALSSENASL